VYYVLIGIIAGLGAIAFYFLCQIGTHIFLDLMAGYRPPSPAGEHSLFLPTNSFFNRYILLLVPALGGILSGILVYTFAPEAEGHGTDAAIDAYHNKAGFIRGRVPIIKTIASAITLTSGGSGGREGPIAQIGAGFGSFLGTILKLSERERRIMMAAGIGAGVGSIFRAPLAGALFAAEVLYRDPEFEYEVIIPSGIASVVAYCLFCLVFGWGTLFESPYFTFQNPLELGPYLVLAFVLSATVHCMSNHFTASPDLLKSFAFPNTLNQPSGVFVQASSVISFPRPCPSDMGSLSRHSTMNCRCCFFWHWQSGRSSPRLFPSDPEEAAESSGLPLSSAGRWGVPWGDYSMGSCRASLWNPGRSWWWEWPVSSLRFPIPPFPQSSWSVK